MTIYNSLFGINTLMMFENKGVNRINNNIRIMFMILFCLRRFLKCNINVITNIINNRPYRYLLFNIGSNKILKYPLYV